MQHAAGRGLHQHIAVPQQSTQLADRVRRAEGAAQQSHRVQVAQPLAVRYVALAPGRRAHVAGVDQHYLEATRFQDLEYGYPVDAGRLHSDGRHLTLLEPVGQGVQVAGKGGKFADRRAGAIFAYRCEHRFGAYVHASGIRMNLVRSCGASAGASALVASHREPPIGTECCGQGVSNRHSP